jgi:hypothetical protein
MQTDRMYSIKCLSSVYEEISGYLFKMGGMTSQIYINKDYRVFVVQLADEMRTYLTLRYSDIVINEYPEIKR